MFIFLHQSDSSSSSQYSSQSADHYSENEEPDSADYTDNAENGQKFYYDSDYSEYGYAESMENFETDDSDSNSNADSADYDSEDESDEEQQSEDFDYYDDPHFDEDAFDSTDPYDCTDEDEESECDYKEYSSYETDDEDVHEAGPSHVNSMRMIEKVIKKTVEAPKDDPTSGNHQTKKGISNNGLFYIDTDSLISESPVEPILEKLSSRCKKRKSSSPGSSKRKIKIQKPCGEVFVTGAEKIMSGQTCKDCPLKCPNRITKKLRQQIFREFWRLTDEEKQQYYLTHIKESGKKLSRKNFKRKFSRKFYLAFATKTYRVCETYYLNTLADQETKLFEKFTKK